MCYVLCTKLHLWFRVLDRFKDASINMGRHGWWTSAQCQSIACESCHATLKKDGIIKRGKMNCERMSEWVFFGLRLLSKFPTPSHLSLKKRSFLVKLNLHLTWLDIPVSYLRLFNRIRNKIGSQRISFKAFTKPFITHTHSCLNGTFF